MAKRLKKQVQKQTEIRLKDYTPPDFLIDSVFFHFDLNEEVTLVKAMLQMKRNPKSKNKNAELKLNGEEIVLRSVSVNGKVLRQEKYKITPEFLIIDKLPKQFTLETEVEIKPQNNTTLSGLYKSSGNYCTQCEPHGFRRITYFLDRPDVMTRFTTTITADKKLYPVLLSNGNLIETKQLGANRHSVKWEDPSLKPSYLFALVAGKLDCLEDKFITMSGKTVALKLYVEQGKLNQAQFAMKSLQQAMRWDEQTYGREYDLAIYMIVAVSDFNMGAMENKGLNLFNDRYILANPKTATDDDFINISSVIGHEYFHNWTGNRITCRDWFQITLKEGLTIFRDQGFTASVNSPIVKRIQDVNIIRGVQFAQDAGPMAHSIRPDHYIEVNNFYTVTVYNKGSEVIRMMRTLLGPEKFRRAMDLYFKRYDGQAVTTSEFVKSMEDAGHIDLTQFQLWYSQAGTPVLDIKSNYNKTKKTYTLTVAQSCPPTPGQRSKKPYHIPIAVGLLDAKTGKDLLQPATQILQLKKKKQSFTFKDIAQAPIPSLLRDFSAPVKLQYNYGDAELLFLLKHDSDGFNRWDAGQTLATKIIFQLVKQYRQNKALKLAPAYVDAFHQLLVDKTIDLQLLTQMLQLPRMAYLIEQMKVADIEALHHVREFIKTELTQQLQANFFADYDRYYSTHAYQFSTQAIGRRQIANLCLSYLMQLDKPDIRELCLQQMRKADNMTNELGGLSALINADCVERKTALSEFYKKWEKENLVIDKWFSLQALSNLPNTLDVVKDLLNHPAFNIKNPNRARALIGAFVQYNYINFHDKSGKGYEFLADQIQIIDPMNPQLSARLIDPLIHWRKFDKNRQKLMCKQLKRIAQLPKLSKDVYEIVTKSLKA
jgi:aminopeptidase N